MHLVGALLGHLVAVAASAAEVSAAVDVVGAEEAGPVQIERKAIFGGQEERESGACVNNTAVVAHLNLGVQIFRAEIFQFASLVNDARVHLRGADVWHVRQADTLEIVGNYNQYQQ